MVEHQLRARGIRDPQVLDAIGKLPREEFVPPQERDAAYEDRALQVGPGETISQPFIVAYMTEKLHVSAGQSVLEIGGGTGYQTALLSMLGARVVSIESDPLLVEEARERFERLNIRGVRLICADGSLGWPELAPYDRVLVTAGAPSAPPALVEQLVEGGRMIIPVGAATEQTLVCVVRRHGGYTEYPLIACRFVKLVGAQGWR
jgi:protein-L-isoaspartate(D-aspartate) O-methyltransferase